MKLEVALYNWTDVQLALTFCVKPTDPFDIDISPLTPLTLT